MSYYYKYNFISPESIYAIVAEEFKSYMDTGAIDTLMFPTYTHRCLQKLGKGIYPIMEGPLYVEDFVARLPDNFHAVREAWACIDVPLHSYQEPSSFYSQTASNVIQVAPLTVGGVPCGSSCDSEYCDNVCLPEVLQAVYKTNHEVPRYYKRHHLLKPGNISTSNQCDVSYSDNWEFYQTLPTNHQSSLGSATYDSFDIRDNKFVTNFRNGTVHLVFYAYDYDNIGNILIPDNPRIHEYIEAYLKLKLVETLTNQVFDETFNQLQQKLGYYKQLADEALVMAMIEVKKQTIYDKQRRIRQDLNRLNMYELPGRVNRVGRRRY